MLTVLEILIIAVNIPVLAWALLPAKRVPRFLDFMPLAAVVLLVVHLLIDNEPARIRVIPIYIFTIILFLITIVRVFRHNPDQPKRRILAAAGRISGLLILAVCVFIPTVVLPFHSLPEPTGSFDVGTLTTDFIDNDRLETFSKEMGKAREISVQFWYPVDRTGSEPRYEIEGLPVSAIQRNFPVLIFSHGAFGIGKSNASTFRELASHGYIVASINHTYHSFYTSLSDGRTIPVNIDFLNDAMGVQTGNIPADETFKITHDWLKLRTGDIELVIDSLKTGELGSAGSILNGHMDLSKIGLFGHSLGGAASAQVARERDEIGAAIVIDGTMIGDITGLNSDNTDMITDKSFDKPLMLMYGSLFLNREAKATSYLPNINAFNRAADEAYSLCIKDSGHLNFTDLPRVSPLLSGMLGVGTIDSLECIRIVNAYTLAFFDRSLKEKPSSLLEGTDGYEQVEFQKRIPAR